MDYYWGDYNIAMRPFDYFQKIAHSTRERLDVEPYWAHVLKTSQGYAIRQSDYGKEPLLQIIRDQLQRRCLDKIDTDAPASLTTDRIQQAAEAMEDYEKTESDQFRLHERVLRWLSDGPEITGDWTLEIWRTILGEYRLTPSHFVDASRWAQTRAPVKTTAALNDQDWENALNQLVGLAAIKAEVHRLRDFLRLRRLRQERNLCSGGFTLHQVFLGNPGTGKTSVARILAQVYQDFGFLSKGHLVETDRSGLVGQYVGATEAKTEEAIRSALGGVLFIDEAYSLARGGTEDFGPQAIDTLVKMMEDHRHDLVVIVAGYSEEMKGFLASNSGLGSRFTRFFTFPDYQTSELREILVNLAQREDSYLPTEVLDVAGQLLEARRKSLGNRFGNAREVRNLWEAIQMRQAERLVATGLADANITDEMLRNFTVDDIPY